MEVHDIPTEELAAKAAPYNPRSISEHDLAALQRSLRYYGVVEPIVVKVDDQWATPRPIAILRPGRCPQARL